VKSLQEAAKIIQHTLAHEPESELRSWLHDIAASDACIALIHSMDNLPTPSDPHFRDVVALVAGIRIGIEMEKE
jgi:hypothetical protein